MPRKKRSPIDVLFYDPGKVLRWRWEFVRRNPDYETDRAKFVKLFGTWFRRRNVSLDACSNVGSIAWKEFENAVLVEKAHVRAYYRDRVEPYLKAFRMKWGVLWPCPPNRTADYCDPDFWDRCPCFGCPFELRIGEKLEHLAESIRHDSFVYKQFVTQELEREWQPFHEDALKMRRIVEEKDPFLFAIEPTKSQKENIRRFIKRLQTLAKLQKGEPKASVRIDHCEEYIVVWDCQMKGCSYRETIEELIRKGVIKSGEYSEGDEYAERALNQRVRRSKVAAREYVAGKFRYLQWPFPLIRLF